MKQLLVKCTLFVLLIVGFRVAANAQRAYIRVQPTVPTAVIVHTAAYALSMFG